MPVPGDLGTDTAAAACSRCRPRKLPKFTDRLHTAMSRVEDNLQLISRVPKRTATHLRGLSQPYLQEFDSTDYSVVSVNLV